MPRLFSGITSGGPFIFEPAGHDPVIRIYDETGDLTEPHGHKGEFKEP